MEKLYGDVTTYDGSTVNCDKSNYAATKSNFSWEQFKIISTVLSTVE